MADDQLTLGTTAYDYFRRKGMPDHQAAAMAGNFAWESGGRHNNVNKGDNWKNNPHAPHSFGIAQWNGDRLTGLVDWGRKRGINVPQGDFRDPRYVASLGQYFPTETQLDYAWDELQGREKRAYDTLSGGTDLRSATAGAVSYYRPQGFTWNQPYNAHGFQGRFALADKIMRLGGPSPGAAPQQGYDMYGESARPTASAPITTGSTPGSPPMADFTNSGLSPEEVALRRRYGQQAYAAGSDASPVGHWTQALARVVQGANAGVWNAQAQEGEREGRAATNKALTNALMSNNPQAAIAAGLNTPYGTEAFAPLVSGLVQQKISEQGEGAQAKLANLRADTAAKNAEANKAGFMPLQPGTGIANISGGRPEVVVQGGVKPPPGYEMDPMSPGAMRPIPGGPADIKFTEKRHQALTQVEGARQRTNDLVADIDAVIKHPGLKSNFGLRGYVPNMPGSQAADAWQLIQQLKARGSFQILQNMREMSKTGGALGAVSDSENRKLESAFAALEKAQSPEQTVRELMKVQRQIKQSQALVDLAYQREYGDKGTPAQVPTRDAPKAEINTQDILKQAKKAPDGNLYIPDPDRPGKYLKVE